MSLVPLERDSRQEWKGLASQKFVGSRRHFNIGETLSNCMLPSLGRKHFDEKFDRPKQYHPHLKVFPEQRNMQSKESLQPTKKLIYVPAQKKSKPFKIKISFNDKSGKTIKFMSSENKMNWKEKEKIEAMREDQRSVLELNQWEHKIRKLLDPFYIPNDNEKEDFE